MKRVAVFGNTGAGKSATSRKIAAAKSIPLFVLDEIQFRPGGKEVDKQQFIESHNQLMAQPEWVIDGFGNLETLWPRLEIADTLVYIDLPLRIHFWWVTKRFLKGLFTAPKGWPEKTPLLKATLNSYKVLRVCHQRLTPAYRRFVKKNSEHKMVIHIRSVKDLNHFLNNL